MPEFARVVLTEGVWTETIPRERRMFAERPVLAPNKPKWVAVINEPPPYDPLYQTQALNGFTLNDQDAPAEITFTYATIYRALATIKAEALVRVDDEAEIIRGMFLTGGSGQALEYQRTIDEAREAHATAGTLTPAGWPMLNAERLAVIGAGGSMTMRQAVALVLRLDAEWAIAGGEIKRVRRLTKLRIEAAEDVATIAALFPIAWPTP